MKLTFNQTETHYILVCNKQVTKLERSKFTLDQAGTLLFKQMKALLK